MKTKTLIIITSILGIVLIILGIIYTCAYNKKIKNSKDEIVSVVTIDINPSIKVSLNKNDEIVNVEALNEDAKTFVKEEYKGITFNAFVSNLATDLKKMEISNDLVILINVEGNIKAKEIIETTFDDADVNCIVYEPIITDEAKEKALEYGISEAKAAYIEKTIKENEKLTYEDLKDKSITEINNAKEPEPVVIDTPSEQTQPVYNPPVSNTYPDPPTDPSSSEWCSWNANRPQWYNYTYDKMFGNSNIMNVALNSLGVTYMDIIGNWTGGPIYEPRSSYCLAYKAIITTRSLRTTLLIDSVTKEIIEKNSVAVPTPAITSDQAVDLCLNHFGLNKEDCMMCVANYSTNGEGSSNFYYRYDVSLNMKDGTYHIINVNAVTGNIVNVVR